MTGAPPRLSPQQMRGIIKAQSRINIYDGSVRSGKTVCSLIRFLDDLANGPRGGSLLSGKTKDTIGRNAFEPLQELLGAEYDHSVQYTPGSNEAWIFGRKVHVIGANDAKAEGRIRGMTLQRAYIDEATLVPEGFFKQVLARLSRPGAKLFATTNPDSPRHWLKTGFIDRESELDLTRLHFTLDDNPGLDPEYIASLKAEYTGLWYRRFIQGEWVVAAGAIYDQWDPKQHVVQRAPGGQNGIYRTWLAADYGTTNPFHALLFGLSTNGVVYVLDEWRWDSKQQRRQKTDAEYSSEMTRWVRESGVNPEWYYIDPSAASFRNQLYSDRVPGVREAANEVLDGIRTVASALTSGRLKILARCRYLIDEIAGYVWDEKAQERGEDAPFKKDDHGVDALRYGMQSSSYIWRNLDLTT